MPDRDRRRRWPLVGLVLLVAVGVAGLGAYRLGYLDELTREDVTRPETIDPPEQLALPEVRPAAAVLFPASGPATNRQQLRDRVTAELSDRRLGRHVGLAVHDLGRDRLVWSSAPEESFVPASSMKIFTCFAALGVMPPDHRFETSTHLHQRGAGPARVVLEGGGDPLLASRPDTDETAPLATLSGLATRTADALAGRGIRRVRLGYDASLFSGPAVNPAWEADYVPQQIVSPVVALWADEGRPGPSGPGRVPRPADYAAQTFAAALERRDVRVVGEPRPARARGREVAVVRSLPLADIVERVLLISDNEAAEVLFRHVALAVGREGSSEAAQEVVRSVLREHDVPVTGMRILDGSGLARGNEVTLAATLGVLRVVAQSPGAELAAMVDGLPVAGWSGSLFDRFVVAGTAAGRGYVRAKTGTLSGVRSLAGYVVDGDGTPLAFAVLADRIRGNDVVAEQQLDRVVARVAGCGCAG